MLTRELAFGMNILSLAGFVLMGAVLTLNRHRRIGAPVAFALMGAGTVLIFAGLYLARP